MNTFWKNIIINNDNSKTIKFISNNNYFELFDKG